ncbi:hypothetical protein [Streptomyces sp. ME19-01-6]|uniref:hypothetical protein n=1 Tax=Streptomyces sp. ME19-01-6 TaxID=3028686 RepID=UPI0029AE0D96|nr:hypothetical protein [Streptomyces sp. ME19-01-6]MDX3226084.1 hypothetical protein [Streptomyces sp. ME19-01-6]
MTSQTQQSPAPIRQGRETHHFILTLQMPLPGGQGFATSTFEGACTPRPGMTRAEVYRWLRADVAKSHPQLEQANVIFFSLESNQL